MKNNKSKDFFEQLNKANSIAICTSGDQKSLNAGVALSMYLKEKHNKSSFVVYTGDLEDVDTIYSEYAEIRGTLSNKSLRIIIDYKDTDITSLQWEKTDDHKLMMYLKPINKSFDISNIKYEYEGVDVDMIITVGIQSLEELGNFFTIYKKEFEDAFVVNIDNSSNNKNYGNINFVYNDTDSIISLILRKFADWKYTPNTVISTILLYGLHKHSEVKLNSVEQS